MRIGLFFGTFNPIHIGHLIIANHIQQFSNLDEVWFIVTPRSPFKKNDTLADDNNRYYMVERAIEEYPYLRASNIEFSMPQPNYTTHTLAQLREKHPNNEFCLIMGEDNLSSLHKWKNADFLVREYDIYVYPRIHADVKKPQISLNKIHKIENAPIIEISATFIREAIKEGKNIKPLLHPKVFDFIDGSALYK